MAKQSGQKLKLLHILDILKKYSDEDHPINASQIAERLSDRGIVAERKSIYDDILNLEDYGYDIIKAPSNKGGWFLGEREFEVPEIYLLSDAVKSAKFISASKTRDLLSKLKNMLSSYEANKRQNAVYFNTFSKCSNEELFYSIDEINRAIENKKQISFIYSSRGFDNNRNIIKKEKEMTVNPYALTWQDDHYYLVGNHNKYDNLLHLRLERMSKVKMLDTASRHFSEVCPYTEFFDIADYTEKLFGMYGGECSEVELCCDKSIVEQVLDRFGEQVFIKNVTETTFSFTVKLRISEALVTWILNYGEKITVKKPQFLSNMIVERINNVLKNYSEE